MTRRPFTITKLERAGDFFRARVTDAEGRTFPVDNKFGSWQADVRPYPYAKRTVRRPVLPHVALELQAQVRRIEKREEVAA